MTNHELIPENILIACLESYEQGRTISELTAAYPSHQREIEAVLSMAARLKAEGAKLNPRPELLSKILHQLDIEPVTTFTGNRYINRGHTKGRTSISLITNLKYAMKTTWKIAIPAGLIAIAALVMFTMLKPETPTAPTGIESYTQNTPAVADTTNGEKISEPSAAVSQAADTGSAEAMVNELLELADAELTMFNDETGDHGLISYDSAELNNLLTAYDANQY